MKVKTIELRDRATFIAAIAISVSGEDGYLARRAGYGHRCVLFGRLGGGRLTHDPFDWGDRTWKTAHLWLCEHFDEVEDGAVVDVEFVLGEKSAPTVSESAT